VAHGIGSIAALVLIVVASKVLRPATTEADRSRAKRGPFWAYLGGIPGALTVVLGAITVNSSLALSGTLALMLVGQVLFGIFSDHFGLFGVPKRRFVRTDFFVVLSVLVGSGIVIFFRP